jgi:hypothetical protein
VNSTIPGITTYPAVGNEFVLIADPVVFKQPLHWFLSIFTIKGSWRGFFEYYRRNGHFSFFLESLYSPAGQSKTILLVE